MGITADRLDDLFGKRVRWQDHCRIARVDAGKLDVLQHSTDDNGAFFGVRSFKLADISNAIHVNLRGVLQKFVHEHRAFRRGLDGETHVMLKFGVGINDLHRAAAQHKGRTDQNRVAEFFGDLERLGFVGGNPVGRLRNFELVEHRGEEFAVLGDFNALRRGADDVDAIFLQTEREVERRLAAELRDGAPALLALVNVQHVFERKRLEK